VYRAEWIEAISKVSKELRKTDVVEPAATKAAPKADGATVAKQGIKVCVAKGYSKKGMGTR